MTQFEQLANRRRRKLLGSALSTLALGAAPALPLALARAAQAASAKDDHILVVYEMSGGNDGLNTLVPYGDDMYYRHRPKLGIKPAKLRKINDHLGWSPGMAGFERLYKDGNLAVINGCGYANPSFSHFTSMAYWHTAAPNSGGEYGWVGRLADRMYPAPTANLIVNVDTTQSLAVKSRVHTPVVFDDPDRFMRESFFQEKSVLDAVSESRDDPNPSRRYLLDVARGARDASQLVRNAWAHYKSPVDYGIVPGQLPKVAALIEAGLPSRFYYAAYRNNAFDTHVQQADLHSRLLTYVSDSVAAFFRDMERIGKADQVTMLIFSEFGRRVPENANQGTDHGTANYMFVAGKQVKGGLYGEPVSLAKLDAGDNLIHTTDFRRVYASLMQGWMGIADPSPLLGGQFETFPLIG
jgi:uncharacterized protein (DUF1501 family)